MKKAWDRLGWVVALIAISIFTLRMVWGREMFCGETDENCAREWISALSGYFAVAAAWATISAMNSQRKEQIRFQAENVELEITGKLALVRRLARSIEQQSFFIDQFCDRLPRLIARGDTSAPAIFHEVGRRFETSVDLPSLERFRDEIGWTGHIGYADFAFNVKQVPKYAEEFYTNYHLTEDIWSPALEKATSRARLVGHQLNEIAAGCVQFEKRWEARIADLQD